MRTASATDAPSERTGRPRRSRSSPPVPTAARVVVRNADRTAHLYATSPGVKCLLWYGKERKKPAGSYKWFEGNLFEVSDKAIEFVKEKLDLRIGGHTLGAQSDDTFEIDERIVTEMINNGIAHRDYASSATVQVELFKDRLTVFSPGPLHPDMKFEMLSVDHQSYATNPIIARALYFVKYIEEVGSGISDIFAHCVAHGLEPPIFEVGARHVSVTVKRPTFDENGRQVGLKTSEVGAKDPKVGANTEDVGANEEEVRANFDSALANYRKDFRETCFKVWQLLREDSSLTQRDIYPRLRLAYSSVQSAYNALQEVGLLHREGHGRGTKWIVGSQPAQPITKDPKTITKGSKPTTKECQP